LTQNKCIYGEPAILNDGGVAIAASDASDGLYILNADGSFRARSGSEVSPRTSNKLLVLKDGTIVVISNGSLLLVNSDGSLRSEFSFPHGSPDNSKPAVMNDGTIVIGSDKNIFFLNPDGPLKAIYQIRSEGYGNRSEVAIQNNGMVILETGGKSLEFILLTPNK
jgi:outer membrane protein assembly factor BamB